MKRLLFARGPNGHNCLVPTDIPPSKAGDSSATKLVSVVDPAFVCACGETYSATLEPLSYTTAYDKRCLNSFDVFKDGT